MNKYNLLNSVLGWLLFAVSLVTYTLTLEPTVSFWDCGEFISASYRLQICHPPGAPLFLMIGRVFSLITANDGIAGIGLQLKRTKLLQHIIFEYIYTANQGHYYSGLAKLFKMKDPHAIEIENNFNGTHGGWHYMDRGIGTPLVVYEMESKGRNGYGFSLNVVKAYYIGFQGILPNELLWKLRAAYSLHTSPKFPGFPIKEYDGFIPQTSLGFQLSKNAFKNLNVQAEIGYDQGERITNTLGMKLAIRYVIN
jgi:hypothetical protein